MDCLKLKIHLQLSHKANELCQTFYLIRYINGSNYTQDFLSWYHFELHTFLTLNKVSTLLF